MSLVRSFWFSRPAGACVAALVAATLAGGCSTDVSRFDMPVFGASDGAAPPLPAPRGRNGVGGPLSAAPASEENFVRPTQRIANGGSGGGFGANGAVNVASLPDVGPTQPKIPVDVPPARKPAARPAAAPAPAAASAQSAPSTPTTGGQTIEVAAGDTLYRIAHQHRVSINDLMAANGMQSPVIKPGQKLVIPAGTSVAQNRVPTRSEKAVQQAVQTMRPASAEPAATPARTPVASLPAPGAPAAGVAPVPAAAPGGTYTIQPGESFYGIARKHKVKSDDLAAVNGITDVTKIRQGQALKIPGPGVTVPAAASAAPVPAQTAAAAPPHAAPAARATTTARPAPVGATGTRVASLGGAGTAPSPADAGLAATPIATDAGSDPTETAAAAKGQAEPVAKPAAVAATPAAGGPTAFRWPVKGRVITKFGPRDDGSHNDGINIAVPAGTDVQAAEGGTVAYAGNELKGYGNLVLIRHDESWVSAYAHNDQLLVKRGDKIKRGQIIAKAGKSGTVEQPQVHFELRQGSKPVDPLKHLASN